jgi:ubiquinone/menaquinone biosynthesis C-methylase UbiE
LLTAAIAEQYPWVEMNALELSTDMIAMAKKIVGRMQPACRIRFIEGNVEDHSQMIHLGKFDLVYSTFSLHHWDKPIQAIKSIYRSIKTGGMMLLFDLKRVPWLYVLPARNGFIESIRAAYRSSEIRKILSRAHINHYRIRTPFPYFWHSILIEK